MQLSQCNLQEKPSEQFGHCANNNDLNHVPEVTRSSCLYDLFQPSHVFGHQLGIQVRQHAPDTPIKRKNAAIHKICFHVS